MPKLAAFDDEFGPGPATILRPRRRAGGFWFWSLIGLMLGAGIIGALALGWPGADAWLTAESQPATTQPARMTAAREGADEEVTRLLREVATLKSEIRDLTKAQQQAADTIAALTAAPEARLPTGIGIRTWRC